VCGCGQVNVRLSIDLGCAASFIISHHVAETAYTQNATKQTTPSEVQRLLSAVPSGSLVGRVDAMLMDLGVSSMQLDTAERGFSFAADGPLDMRLNPDAPVSAADIVNGWSEARLGSVLLEYGEERAWKLVARRIVEAREAAPIVTTQQLVRAVGQTIFRDKKAGGRGKGKQIHPATRTFQVCDGWVLQGGFVWWGGV